jgi:transposase-like protein
MARQKALSLREAEPASDGPVFGVELSLPQARTAVEAFAANRVAALEALSRSLREAVGDWMNQLLNAEMAVFLGKPAQRQNRRNGYTVREYSLKGIGTFEVRVPRDRMGTFKSRVIPASERLDPRLRQDLALLHLAGLSSRTLEGIARRVLGMEVSRGTVLQSLEPLQQKAQAWLTRPLEGEYWALYIDAMNVHTRRRDSVELEPLLFVVGVDETNHRSILAVEPGARESAAAWKAALSDLKSRGLKASSVRIGVMDGLPGLENAFREAFPRAVTARCWVHAMRNAVAKAPGRLREPFKEMAGRVMYAASEDAARKAFSKLKDAMQGDAQKAVACIEKDLDALVAHYKFEKKFWQALKTSNPVERVHREVRRRTKTMDAVGEGNLNVLIAFTALRLEAGWRRQRIDSRAIYNVATKSREVIESEETTRVAMETLVGPESAQ